jgi:hypothetical protein
MTKGCNIHTKWLVWRRRTELLRLSGLLFLELLQLVSTCSLSELRGAYACTPGPHDGAGRRLPIGLRVAELEGRGVEHFGPHLCFGHLICI